MRLSSSFSSHSEIRIDADLLRSSACCRAHLKSIAVSPCATPWRANCLHAQYVARRASPPNLQGLVLCCNNATLHVKTPSFSQHDRSPSVGALPRACARQQRRDPLPGTGHGPRFAAAAPCGRPARAGGGRRGARRGRRPARPRRRQVPAVAATRRDQRREPALGGRRRAHHVRGMCIARDPRATSCGAARRVRSICVARGVATQPKKKKNAREKSEPRAERAATRGGRRRWGGDAQ